MSNNSFRQIGAGINFLSPTDFIVQVDTSAGAVQVVLPKIATILASYTTLYQYMGIRFIDISNNASVNNITLTGFETDTINGSTNTVLNTNGTGGILTLIGDGDWSFQQNATGGSGAIPTLQQVLDFNHDLVDGNNFQGTCAGVGNSGTNVIAIGTYSAFCNTGNNVDASGSYSAYCNTGNEVTASGSYNSAYCNIGNDVTASGYRSAFCNTGNNVTASGFYSAFQNTGSYVTA